MRFFDYQISMLLGKLKCSGKKNCSCESIKKVRVNQDYHSEAKDLDTRLGGD